ncbi:hypothetical protein DFH07DRAFT_963810 [Mycena maculata]|uniref:F-box domain-containing protein n=1 Tax=Mycena maculata TaxID=230809 RepID=A0AAD7IKI7_9AGAR|nr:hypothetical protein DFH07DRAFT_963810 [Mycena maculata]
MSSAQLTCLLESNNVPLDAEIPTICEIISENQTRLDALNAQIEALRTAMEQLITERDEIADSVKRRTTVISPLRRVPSELICEIFSLSQFTRRIGGEIVNCPPWYLGHVCRSWRYSALSTPFLWSSIEISKPSIDVPLTDIYPLSMIETQLLRSGSVPLQVSVDWWTDDEGPLFDSLLLQCERWSTVCFIDNLNLWDDEYDFLSLSPNLRKDILTDSKLQAWSPPLLIPWTQITHYRGSYSPESQMDILQAAPNLVECGISLDGGDDPIPDGREATLSHLRRLHVGDPVLLGHITAPLLRDLFFSGSMSTALPFADWFPFFKASKVSNIWFSSCAM